MKSNYHIMLIDDDDDDRMLFSMALEMINKAATCTAIDNCFEALELLSSGVRPDIIFLDLNMPSMHGFDCLQLIRQSPDFGTIPVVIYSTSGYSVDIEKARDLNAAGYLKKQSDLDALCLKVKKFIDYILEGNNDYISDTQW